MAWWIAAKDHGTQTGGSVARLCDPFLSATSDQAKQKYSTLIPAVLRLTGKTVLFPEQPQD
jgi:hypothetical protein